MTLLHAYLALWLLPLVVFLLSRRTWPEHSGLFTGIAVGIIVSPASMGLYALFYSGYIIGMLGFCSSMIHEAVTYRIATASGIVPENTVVEGVLQFYMFIISATVWSIVYGGLGKAIDILRRRDDGPSGKSVAEQVAAPDASSCPR